jgi:hypothetical protein
MTYKLIEKPPCLPIFVDMKVKQLDYNSPELSILRKLDNEESSEETPIDSEFELHLDMNRSKHVQLLKDLAFFTLPPIDSVSIIFISKAEEEVKHFLIHSLGTTRALRLNCYRIKSLMDGSQWTEAIVQALPKIKQRIELWKFSFSKQQVEVIVDNSHHLERLEIMDCKLRKLCCLVCEI